MAPPAKSAVKPPDTLPADFFDKESAPDTLPANFNFGGDNDAAPKGNPFQQSIDQAAQSEPLDFSGIKPFAKSIGANLGAGAVRATLSPLAHPLQALGAIGDIPLAPFSRTSAQNLLNEGKGLVKAFRTNPAGETLATLPSAALAFASGSEGQPLSEAERAAQAERPWLKLASAIGPTGSSQKSLGVTPALAEDLREVVPQMGKITAKTPLGFAKEAEAFRNNIAIPSYQTVSEPWAEESLGGALQPPLSEFKMSTGKPLGSTPTVAQSEQALRELNELTGPSYQAGANTFERQSIMGNKAMASNLRNMLNQRIGELSGHDAETVGKLRERMGQSRNIAENAAQRSLANSLGIDSAPAVAMKAGMARSMPARFFRATVAEPIENWQFRRALSGVTPQEASRLAKILRPARAAVSLNATPAYAFGNTLAKNKEK